MTPMMWLSCILILLSLFTFVGSFEEQDKNYDACKQAYTWLFMIGILLFVCEQWIIPFLKWGHQFM